LFVVWIRRNIQEPEIYHAIRRDRSTVGLSHLLSAFRAPYLWTTVKVSLMVAGAQGGGYALGIWMPTYLRTVRGLSASSTGGFLLTQIFGALLGFLAGAWLSDAIGRRLTFMLSAIGSLLMVLVFMFVPMGNTALLFVGLPFFAVLLMKFPPMGPFMTELYPTAVRGNAQGFCYNAGRAIGALFPTLVGVLSETMPLGPAIAVFSAIAFGLMIVMLFLLPETKGRSLDSLETGVDAPAPMLNTAGRNEIAS
jgi:sugar phosphate permease